MKSRKKYINYRENPGLMYNQYVHLEEKRTEKKFAVRLEAAKEARRLRIAAGIDISIHGLKKGFLHSA